MTVNSGDFTPVFTWSVSFKAPDPFLLSYSEGEYFHYFGKPIGGYNPKTKNVDSNGWRKGLPPQYYPTHSNAYYIGVMGGSFICRVRSDRVR